MARAADRIPDFLTTVPFFAEVAPNSLLSLGKRITLEHFEKGDTIFQKGEEGDAMYVIFKGKVRVHENEHHFGYLEEQDCFGEYALIDRQRRSASVKAVEDTEVVKITRDLFLELMDQDQGFSRGILSVMIKRHRELDSIQERLSSSKKQLEIANAKMSGLINGAMDAIIMFDQNFRIILTNPSAEQLLENNDVLQRNVLFFFDDASATLIESLVKTNLENPKEVFNQYLPEVVKVIGSDETITLNEGTLSKYGEDEAVFYTLILRNIHDRLAAEDTINLLTNQTQYLEEEIKELTSNYGIVAKNQAMAHVLNQIEQVAKTDVTVLIQGETGTGKELVARALHKASDRNDKPLIRINCGAIPANLIESELFGHEKGAFTGATATRKGRFLLADKGTLFLDEIGELPLELQPKLLRVIQEGEFDAVGSSETTKVDVRIIAATHRDLQKLSKESKFREDLYYRLNVFPIAIPPLRDRGEDLYLIAQEMIDQFAAKLNKKVNPLSSEDKALLTRYTWPGNVRELQNIIERAIIVTRKKSVEWETFIPFPVGEDIKTTSIPSKIYSASEMTKLERENILRALRETGWKISGHGGAAALLQVPPTTLASKIKALNITRPV